MTDTLPILRFDGFALDRADRQVCRDGAPLELGDGLKRKDGSGAGLRITLRFPQAD